MLVKPPLRCEGHLARDAFELPLVLEVAFVASARHFSAVRVRVLAQISIADDESMIDD